MLPSSLLAISSALGTALQTHNAMLATAESCTGGLAGVCCTAIAGSSCWFSGGIIAYANDIKHRVLGVDLTLLAEHGAVSRYVVEAMATGVCDLMHCHAAIAISGVAGPGGGTGDKPVGTVWIGWCYQTTVYAQHFLFAGTREKIRHQAAAHGIHGMLHILNRQQQGPHTTNV